MLANKLSYDSVVGVTLVSHFAIIPEMMSQTSCSDRTPLARWWVPLPTLSRVRWPFRLRALSAAVVEELDLTRERQQFQPHDGEAVSRDR